MFQVYLSQIQLMQELKAPPTNTMPKDNTNDGVLSH